MELLIELFGRCERTNIGINSPPTGKLFHSMNLLAITLLPFLLLMGERYNTVHEHRVALPKVMFIVLLIVRRL